MAEATEERGANAPPLHWALVMATYNRYHILRRCVRLALDQSRPPSEIIIVDASDGWVESRDALLQEFGERLSGLRFEYYPARVRSLTHQRNQALEYPTSDIVFMVDDDSLMFPDCAEEIMRVYEKDPDGSIAGVCANLADHAPDEPGAGLPAGGEGAASKPSIMSRVRYFLERRLDVELLLLPYDNSYPDRPLPPGLLSDEVVRCRYFHGMRMTYRRAFVQREGFDELLQRYAAAEDLDASYRVSRHGALVIATKARLYHAQDSSARLSRYTRNSLGLLNLAVLYRLKAADPVRTLRAFRSRVWRRLVVDAARDVLRGRVTMPCVRADWYALRMLPGLLGRSEAELKSWYPRFQVELVERNPS